MITEDYVSFEVAKLLKEKGFDEQCFTYYDGIDKESINRFDRGLHFNNNSYPWGVPYNAKEAKEYVVAPTHQMAMRWLREVHNIHTEICLYKTSENDIEPKKSRKAPYYTFGVWDSTTGDNVDKRLTNDFIGDTYEEAVEASLKYSLENLI